jgi:hypothetical protein
MTFDVCAVATIRSEPAGTFVYGFRTANLFEAQFTTTPEPGTWVMVANGLLRLG